ncbi:hypothetical protein OCV67_12675 [Porcipelethomonas ammoniilytica]|uniref:hypothetical protein n=1 Tax=Porcipelethomonas ammoniilytica TaxID=2981722 RepID=UPI0015AFFA8C|nr:hypothetical protein [Porcipelethomonas ammoniilytica]MCU6720772.1 hypothetical protein [Porcipelethomonas ammoniilytica]
MLYGKKSQEKPFRKVLHVLFWITAKLKGFKKKDGSGTFSAYLMLDKDFKVTFRFK